MSVILFAPLQECYCYQFQKVCGDRDGHHKLVIFDGGLESYMRNET